MKVKNVHFPEQQIERLDALATHSGIKRAEHIRRAIDVYLLQAATIYPGWNNTGGGENADTHE
jgi:predicted DNA-binding protein